MKHTLLCLAAVFLLTEASCSAEPQGPGTGAGGAGSAAGETVVNDGPIALLLEDSIKDSVIPGVVAGILSADGTVRVGAAGVRKAKSDARMQPGDLMHIGSDTKAMTAVLIARLVEQGKLEWTTTVAEGLPELAKRIHPDYGSVTVLDLLRHTSGMPANAPNWHAYKKLGLHERRSKIAASSLKGEPQSKPGKSFLYSNLGVMVAGLMAETATGETWEDLMVAEVFTPLGMSSAGFGVPGVKGGLDQPWGHSVMGKKAVPVQADNAAALGPAGTVHLSLQDWAKFASLFMNRPEAGPDPGSAQDSDLTSESENSFLSPASMHQLTEVGLDDYACGWGVMEKPWARVPGDSESEGRILWHSGSNTFWFATIWVAPEVGKAYFVACNAAGGAVKREMDRMVSALVRSSGDR